MLKSFTFTSSDQGRRQNIVRWQAHPYPQTLTAYPTPVLGGTPGIFLQNDRKGCKRDYLDARGHFVLRFGAIGNNPFGVVTNPLRVTTPLRKTRVKSCPPKSAEVLCVQIFI